MSDSVCVQRLSVSQMNTFGPVLSLICSLIPSTMLKQRRSLPAVGGAVAVFHIRQRGDTFCPGPHVITPTTKSSNEQRRSGCQAPGEKKANSLSSFLSISLIFTVCPRVSSFPPTISLSLCLTLSALSPLFHMHTHK